MSKEKDFYQFFKRFAEDNYTIEDLDWIRKKVENPDDRESIERALRHYWYQYVLSEETFKEDQQNINLDTCLHKIYSRINQKHSFFRESKETSRLKRIVSRSLYFYYRAAAILLIPLLGAMLMYFINIQEPEKPVYSEVYAPKGSRISLDLPDGTHVWLNHGSRLKYPQSFGNDTRKVFLRGEAYFEVKKKEKRDFLVQSSHLDVLVTGTCFNMMAYSEDESVSVSLDEGSVDLYQDFSKEYNETEKITTVKPGEHAEYDKTSNQMEIIYGRNDIYTAWREGKIIFRNSPLKEIVTKLERRYNVEIILENSQVANYTFTATFSDETLPQILDLLSKAAPLEYERTARVKQEDHSYSKGKVIIRLTK